MNLARIDDRKEQQWSHRTFGIYTPWIGLNDRDQEDHFVNSDGCPRPYKRWVKGEPNNHGGNEDCVQMWFPTGWNDNQCNLKFRFLCKRSITNKRTRCGDRITCK